MDHDLSNDSDRWSAPPQPAWRRKKTDDPWGRPFDVTEEAKVTTRLSFPELFLQPSSLHQPAFLRRAWLRASARLGFPSLAFPPEWSLASGLRHRRPWSNRTVRLVPLPEECSSPSWLVQHNPIATLHTLPATHRSIYAWNSLTHSQRIEGGGPEPLGVDSPSLPPAEL